MFEAVTAVDEIDAVFAQLWIALLLFHSSSSMCLLRLRSRKIDVTCRLETLP